MNSFLKFYVMGRTEIDLFGIAHVKVIVVDGVNKVNGNVCVFS